MQFVPTESRITGRCICIRTGYNNNITQARRSRVSTNFTCLLAATNSAFRTETRDEHLYNHIELFNRSSSPIDAPAANRFQDCRGQQPTENQIATGRRMFGDYRTEPSNEHLYNNIQSINKPSSPATESQAANQTSQDDRRGQQPTGNSKTMLRRVSSAMNNTYVDKAIKKVETLRKLSIEKD